MKLHADSAAATAIQAHGEGWVQVAGDRYTASLRVSSQHGVQPWDCASFESIQPAHFAELVALKPELVVFGSGRRLRFPPPASLRPLVEAGIGLETMSTPAACRTFNILSHEGRHVVAVLLID